MRTPGGTGVDGRKELPFNMGTTELGMSALTGTGKLSWESLYLTNHSEMG